MSIKEEFKADGTVVYRCHVEWMADGVREQRTHRVSTRAEAEEWVRTTRAERAPRPSPAPREETLGEFVERYYRSAVGRLADTTIREGRATFSRYGGAIADRPLSEITKQEILDLREAIAARPDGRADRRRHLAPATINRFMASLSGIFTAACDGKPMINPMRGITQFVADVPEVEYWTIEELTRFQRWLDAKPRTGDYWYAEMVECIAWTGIRTGEYVGLETNDVRLTARGSKRPPELFIRRSVYRSEDRSEHTKLPKNGKTRHVTISDRTVAALKAYEERVDGLRTFLGPDFQGGGRYWVTAMGQPLSLQTFAKVWRRLQAAYATETGQSIPTLTPHGLRHTHAMIFLDGGGHAKDLQARLGHHDVSFTLRCYGHADGVTQKDRIDALREDND